MMKPLLSLALLLAATGAPAQDRADIDRAQIIGNRELPKVIYIVPWKKPLPGVLAGRPVHSVIDEALAPVAREVLRREIDYAAQAQARASPSAEDKTAEGKSATPPNRPTAPNGVSR